MQINALKTQVGFDIKEAVFRMGRSPGDEAGNITQGWVSPSINPQRRSLEASQQKKGRQTP